MPVEKAQSSQEWQPYIPLRDRATAEGRAKQRTPSSNSPHALQTGDQYATARHSYTSQVDSKLVNEMRSEDLRASMEARRQVADQSRRFSCTTQAAGEYR